MKKVRFILGSAVETCAPLAIMAVAAVASATFSGTSMVMSANSQKKASDYNEKMGEFRERDALQRGAIEAGAAKDQARRAAGTQAEAIGMSGVASDTGTPLDLLVETAGIGEFNKLRMINNAHREAWGIKSQTDLDVYQQRSQAKGGYLNAAGTFLGGASNAYFGYKSASMKAAA